MLSLVLDEVAIAYQYQKYELECVKRFLTPRSLVVSDCC